MHKHTDLKPNYALNLKAGKGIQFFSQGEDELKQKLTNAIAQFEEAKTQMEAKSQEFGNASAEAKAATEAANELKGQVEKLESALNAMAAKGNRQTDPNGMTDEQREAQQKASQAFYKFMRKGKKGLNTDERKALVEDDNGRIIVPEELDKEIERQLPKETIFRDLVNVRKTSAEKIRKRGLNEVTVGWGKIETNATKTLGDYESDLVASERFIWVENLNGLTKIGLDELEDTDLQLQTYLAASFAQAAAEEEDKAVLVGRGHNFEEPEGILKKTGIAVHETAASGVVEASDLIDLEYMVPAQHRRRGVYVISSKLEQTLRKLKNANGDMIWQESLVADKPNKINGKPYYISDDFDAFGAGTVQAVFGDFKNGYTIVDRKGSSVQRIDELYIEDDLIGFKFKKRVGGGVDKTEAFGLLKIKA